MNSYVSPCISPVGGKPVVADGIWTTNDNVAANMLAVVETAVVLGAVAVAVVLSITV